MDITNIVYYLSTQFLHGFQMVQNIWSSVKYRFTLVQIETNLHAWFELVSMKLRYSDRIQHHFQYLPSRIDAWCVKTGNLMASLISIRSPVMRTLSFCDAACSYKYLPSYSSSSLCVCWESSVSVPLRVCWLQFVQSMRKQEIIE